MSHKGQISYEQALAELHNILSELQNGQINVDTLEEKVKRASELIETCRKKLRQTEDAIQKLENKESNT